jgi:VIT1/CCC1 family predicted Fe2+/Mn2+ transporter
MKKKELPKEIIKAIIEVQRSEITGHHIYMRLAGAIKDENNSDVVRRISEDELRHYRFWQTISGRELKPRRFKIFIFFWISRILGITFGIKLLERDESTAQVNYKDLAKYVPEAERIASEEEAHEHELIEMLEEERLNYIGSIVLGLNDALIEITGALAGLTFALQNTRLIALAGLITGTAASLSMAASEYLSSRAEGKDENALKSSLYTGTAYVITVGLLILPYLLFSNYFICLAVTLTTAILIIFLFNYYLSVARDYSFKKRFLEMAILSLGIAAISFGIGYLIRIFLGVEV